MGLVDGTAQSVPKWKVFCKTIAPIAVTVTYCKVQTLPDAHRYMKNLSDKAIWSTQLTKVGRPGWRAGLEGVCMVVSFVSGHPCKPHTGTPFYLGVCVYVCVCMCVHESDRVHDCVHDRGRVCLCTCV